MKSMTVIAHQNEQSILKERLGEDLLQKWLQIVVNPKESLQVVVAHFVRLEKAKEILVGFAGVSAWRVLLEKVDEPSESKLVIENIVVARVVIGVE